MAEPTKRGPGRPSQDKVHIDITLSKQVVDALKTIPSGERSKFIEEILLAHPHIQQLLQTQKYSHH